MKIHVENILSPYYTIIDKKTKEKIHYCVWANDKQKIYNAYKLDKNDKVVLTKDNKIITETIKKPIKITRNCSWVHMFFNSMVRIYKKIIVLKKLERRNKKCLNLNTHSSKK